MSLISSRGSTFRPPVVVPDQNIGAVAHTTAFAPESLIGSKDMAAFLFGRPPEERAANDDPTSSNSSPIQLFVDAEYGFGVDVGGTKVAGAVVDLDGQIISRREEPTDPRGGSYVFDQIERLAYSMATGLAVLPSKLRSFAVGLPCAVHPETQKIALAPNIVGFDGLDAYAELARRLSGVIAIENDVNLAALAEQSSGAAKGCGSAAFLALGTGTGLGVIVDGELIRGATGSAGEIGYVAIGDDLDSPQVLTQGAFEYFAGSQGMLRRYRQKSTSPIAASREIFDRYANGDRIATEVLEETARAVALSIITLQALLDLELVVLGGSIGAREELANMVRRQIQRHFARRIEVTISQFGNQAGLIGATVLAHRNLLAVNSSSRGREKGPRC